MVNGKGKFEELIVYSKDIAASTAQLVAASRVKARPRSEKLTALKGASKKGVQRGRGNPGCLSACLCTVHCVYAVTRIEFTMGPFVVKVIPIFYFGHILSDSHSVSYCECGVLLDAVE